MGVGFVSAVVSEAYRSAYTTWTYSRQSVGLRAARLIHAQYLFTRRARPTLLALLEIRC